jgi:hypothetical protein
VLVEWHKWTVGLDEFLVIPARRAAIVQSILQSHGWVGL